MVQTIFRYCSAIPGFFAKLFFIYNNKLNRHHTLQTVVRIFDVFVNEGSGILYKVALAILRVASVSLMNCKSAVQFLSTLQVSKLHSIVWLLYLTILSLSKSAFSIKMQITS